MGRARACRRIPSRSLGANCYLVAPGAGEQCVIIDPGEDAITGVEEVVREHRLQPVAVLLTHGHVDHTMSVVPVCGDYGVPAYVHPDDREMLADPQKWLGIAPGTPVFGRVEFAEPADVHELTDGVVLDLAGLEITVDHAPGHTRGSVTFRTPGLQDIPHVLFRGTCCSPDRSAVGTSRAETAKSCWSHWPASACRCRTRPSCCPATAPRPRSAASAPPTRS